MAAILLAMFLGITLLGAELHVVPHEQETVLSQIARAVCGGRNVAYLSSRPPPCSFSCWRPTRATRTFRGWHRYWRAMEVGAIATACVLVVFVTTKFREGAWVVIVMIPLGVWLFLTIARHYDEVNRQLSLEGYEASPDRPDVMVVIVAAMNRETVEAMRYAGAAARGADRSIASHDPDDGC